ncbi:MAG: hypothetical protein IRY91_16875 [Gemmatimonadaceae bacterium]|nr:hypothetical protein [Gemmatimonadaceae bacterium]
MRPRCNLAGLALALAFALVPAAAGHAQSAAAPESASVSTAQPDSGATAARAARTRFRIHFALGFAASILAHETGHIIASYAVGGHPSFGFDKGRPTIYSGIDADLEPHKQFIFSSAGLTVQTVLDEAILDIPHHRGGAFERGILAGGIATVLFYITLGRNGRVSDVAFMARTSSLSKTDVSLIYGGIAALHALRIHRDRHYAHFFAAPSEHGGLKVGLVVLPSRD